MNPFIRIGSAVGVAAGIWTAIDYSCWRLKADPDEKYGFLKGWSTREPQRLGWDYKQNAPMVSCGIPSDQINTMCWCQQCRSETDNIVEEFYRKNPNAPRDSFY